MTDKKHTEVLIPFLSLLLCLLFLCFSSTAYTTADESLKLVGKTVLPILLPYTVLSNIISDTLSAKNRKSAIVTAFAIGNICGAPIGAVAIGRLCSNGVITKKEASILLPAVSCTSPAFCISAVGSSILNNTKFGILIWSVQLIINFTILACFFYKNRTDRITIYDEAGFKIDFSEAISRAASTLCAVSVSVIFFSVLSAVITDLFNLSITAECALNSILEMSGGCAIAGNLNYPLSFLFSAFALGFSGVSVLAQIASCTKGISKIPYIVSKLINGTLCVLIALINSPFFASSIEIMTN